MPKHLDKNKLPGTITVVKRMKDYSKDPVFVKKAEQAAAFLKKAGLPSRFKKNSK